MVSISKLLDQGLRDAKCTEVFHPGRTCTEFFFDHSHCFVTTCIKYFFPVAAVPLLMKGRSMRKEHIWDALKYYLEAVTMGIISSQIVPISLCTIRKLYGRYSKYSFVYIPAMFPALTMYFSSAKIERLYAGSLFQVVSLAAIRNGRNPITRTIKRSKLVQTLMFMSFSAFVLHTVQNYGAKTFWIVRSVPIPKQDENNKCGHNGSCSEFCLTELKKTLMIGCALDLIKIVFSSIPKGSSFLSILKKKLLILDFPTTLFLSSYTGIYRLTSCLLNRTWKANPDLKHIVAAFLGGLSFYFLPRIAILLYGASVCIEIAWSLFKQHEFKDDNQFVKIIKKIPFHRFYASVSTGYLVHMYVFRVHLLSTMGLAIVNGLTGNQADVFKEIIYTYFKNLEK